MRRALVRSARFFFEQLKMISYLDTPPDGKECLDAPFGYG